MASSPAAGSAAGPTVASNSAASSDEQQTIPPGGAPAQRELRAKLNGKEMTTLYAMARDHAGDIDVMIASQPFGCDFRADGAELQVNVGLGWKLTAEGKIVRRVVSDRFDGTGHMGLNLDPKLGGSEREGDLLTLAVSLQSTGASDAKRQLSLEGSIRALVCPADKQAAEWLKEDPVRLQRVNDMASLLKGPPVSTAGPTITVSGHSLPIRSACLDKSDRETTLKLSTAEGTCGSFDGAFGMDISVDKKEPLVVEEVRLYGESVGQISSQTFDPKTIKISPALKGPGEYTLDLKVKLESTGHTVKVNGKITAIASKP